jgi:hypothetical protein
MLAHDHHSGPALPIQDPEVEASAAAIAKALDDFYRQPTVSNKVAAVTALQAHLARIERGRSASPVS